MPSYYFQKNYFQFDPDCPDVVLYKTKKEFYPNHFP